MASLQRLTPHNVGAPPYKSRFSTVTIVPPNTPIAYISTQWAADPATGDMVTGGKGSYYHQAKQVWTNIVAILEELGVGLEACVHRQVNYL